GLSVRGPERADAGAGPAVRGAVGADRPGQHPGRLAPPAQALRCHLPQAAGQAGSHAAATAVEGPPQAEMIRNDEGAARAPSSFERPVAGSALLDLAQVVQVARLAGEEGGQVVDVLIAEATGEAGHDRVLAGAGAVVLQRLEIGRASCRGRG